MPTPRRALAICLVVASAARADINLDDLKPGLVATHADAGRGQYVALEPTVAVALGPGEATHPRLAPDGTARWEGFINVVRAGEYRFAATLRGHVGVTVSGREVFAAHHAGDKPAARDGGAIKLEAGVWPFAVRFTREPGAARLELFWQSDAFRREPLPYDVVFHDPGKRPRELAEDAARDHGRLLYEERGCANCHGVRTAATRQGPNLTKIAARAKPGWLDRWLADPHSLRPGTAMPKVFADDTAGRAERYAVVRYLSTLGTAPKSERGPAKDWDKSVERGRALFVATGCVACHPARMPEPGNVDAASFHGATWGYPLDALGSKTTPAALAAYLRDPHAVGPGGRMPNMTLAGAEATDIARFLCESTDTTIDAGVPEPAGGKDWAAWGRELVVGKGCVNCHAIDGREKAARPAGALKPVVVERHCLAPKPDAKSSPWFSFVGRERDALLAFLTTDSHAEDRPAPAYAAKVALRRFNCLACHQRDGEGGLTAALADEMRKYEKAENAEALTPPPLTGVGHKLMTQWLRQMLTEGKRARPWMGLRMPQYGAANVGSLVEGLTALEGAEPDAMPHAVAFTTQKVEAGRTLVGKAGLGCISCHDFAGIANSGTRGPDLTVSGQRLRHDWYRRWLEQPQRMQPGTKMPQVFVDGKSLLTTVLGGHADAQAEAMWAYCSLGPNAPLPEGLEPPKGLIVTVGAKPVVVRTFLPDAGARAIAVGYPGGVSVAYDAATGRLAYAWAGNFLDASPVWANRGGSPAKALGPRFWEAPPGPTWAASSSAPDFTALGKDPAFGAPAPEGTTFSEGRGYRFTGYEIGDGGQPRFRYTAGREPGIDVTESPSPVRKPAAIGVQREFVIDNRSGQFAWLSAASSREPFRVFEGPAIAPAPYVGLPMPMKGQLVLARTSGRTVALAASADSAVWWVEPFGAEWRLLVRVRAPANVPTRVRLTAWSLPNEEPELLRSLLAQ